MIRFIKIYKFNIILFITGVSIGSLFTILIPPSKESKLSNGEESVVSIDNLTITADNLYQSLKSYGSISIIINQIDTKILNSLYETTKTIQEEIDNQATYYLETASTYYGYSQNNFLRENGFLNLKEFKDNLILEYKRNLYLIDYLKENLSEKEMNNFYENLHGAIDGKYFLISDQKTANAILEDLKQGLPYEKIITSYKDNITIKELDSIEFDSDIDDSIYKELKNLDENTSSKNYFRLDDFYILVFKEKEEKKKDLKSIKERIKTYLAKEKIKQDDGTLANTILNNLREKYNLYFYDTKIKKEYLNSLK